MIVITLTNCPQSLRGDLTKWLLEINSGVYVGQVSARVRDEVWDRVTDCIKSGRATMVFSTNNEQRMDFRVHNTNWEPIDFDGIKLVLRPSPARLRQLSESKKGFSKASNYRMAKKMSRIRRNGMPDAYVATGLSTEIAGNITISAIKVVKGQVIGELLLVIKQQDDKYICETISDFHAFLTFTEGAPLVSHTPGYLYGFLRSLSDEYNLPTFANKCIDTFSLARRLLDDVDDYELQTLAGFFQIVTGDTPSEFRKAYITKHIYAKLIEILEQDR